MEKDDMLRQLSIAFYRDDPVLLNQIFEKYGEQNCRDALADYYIHDVLENGKVKIAEYVIKRVGAGIWFEKDFLQQNDSHKIPLQLAIKHLEIEEMGKLIVKYNDNNIPLTTTNGKAQTIVHIISTKEEYVKLTEKVVQSKSFSECMSSKDKLGDNPVHCAAKAQNLKFIQKVINVKSSQTGGYNDNIEYLTMKNSANASAIDIFKMQRFADPPKPGNQLPCPVKELERRLAGLKNHKLSMDNKMKRKIIEGKSDFDSSEDEVPTSSNKKSGTRPKKGKKCKDLHAYSSEDE